MRRVAVIGSGITGLAAARQLSSHARVTLFEAESWFGGHAHTVDLTLDGVTHGVDTGFLVFNHRTYPLLTQLFATLGVETAASEMSFSVQVRGQGPDQGRAGLEWSGSDLNGVFAQRSNLLRPAFWAMLADILRFNRLCTAMSSSELAQHESLREFLEREHFGKAFRDAYLLPMLGCIWSSPPSQMLEFPLATMIRFCHNHGLLQVRNRPPWYTVRGGSRHYVERIVEGLTDARLATPVHSVRRVAGAAGSNSPVGQVVVRSGHGEETFDELLFACHSDQALALLSDATAAESQLLGAVRYQSNRAVLHTDATVLPTRRAAWAAWNYDRAGNDSSTRVGLHYLINKLQPLPWAQPVIVSLNPERPIAPAQVHGEWTYAHPVFDLGAVRAQRRLPLIQGRWQTWFAGAWCGYGFHEDGLKSATQTVQAMLAQWRQADDRSPRPAAAQATAA